MDENKIVKITKRYNPTQRYQEWENPSPEVVKSIESILNMNKTKALNSTSSSAPSIRTMDKYIKSFKRRLAQGDFKLPTNLNVNDFNQDYQSNKLKFLQSLQSNELNLIDNLKRTIKSEKSNNNELKKLIKNFERSYNDELKKLTQFEDGEHILIKENDINEESYKTIDLKTDETELKELLDELDTSITKLSTFVGDITTFADKLDELNELI